MRPGPNLPVRSSPAFRLIPQSGTIMLAPARSNLAEPMKGKMFTSKRNNCQATGQRRQWPEGARHDR